MATVFEHITESPEKLAEFLVKEQIGFGLQLISKDGKPDYSLVGDTEDRRKLEMFLLFCMLDIKGGIKSIIKDLNGEFKEG